MVVYWYGTTMLAGASLSERLTQACAIIATLPSSANSSASRGGGVTQPIGASATPNTSAAAVCVVTSTVSVVPRRLRVATMSSEKVNEPPSAISAGADSAAEPGRRQTSTPRKPTITALQRRQPTGSRSTVPAMAVTKIGPAR